MADQKHLDILKQGVDEWNRWREENPDVRIDLREADLSGGALFGANLREANLGHANFSEADLMNVNLLDATLEGASLHSATLVCAILRGADLSKADLSRAFLREADLIRADLFGSNLSRAFLHDAALFGANLSEADLREADLREADLSYANFRGADLSKADLSGAILYGATLVGVNLSKADLSGADLYGATLSAAVFGSVDLSTVKGLEAVMHIGPSTIGIDTVYRSKGNIPEAFLRGAGIDDTFLASIRSLVGKAEYYSCFISYSSKDEALARRLYADLQRHNVRCWFAPDDLEWGERIRTGIDEAIRLHDKLLLVLSKSSVASGRVEREVKTALAKERKEKRTVLFPVRVDGAVFDSPFDWATEIRHERNIGDFTRWKDHDEYQKAFNRLLRDLQTK